MAGVTADELLAGVQDAAAFALTASVQPPALQRAFAEAILAKNFREAIAQGTDAVHGSARLNTDDADAANFAVYKRQYDFVAGLAQTHPSVFAPIAAAMGNGLNNTKHDDFLRAWLRMLSAGRDLAAQQLARANALVNPTPLTPEQQLVLQQRGGAAIKGSELDAHLKPAVPVLTEEAIAANPADIMQSINLAKFGSGWTAIVVDKNPGGATRIRSFRYFPDAIPGAGISDSGWLQTISFEMPSTMSLAHIVVGQDLSAVLGDDAQIIFS